MENDVAGRRQRQTAEARPINRSHDSPVGHRVTGRFDEWHLDILNSFEHLAFDHVPRLKHRIVFLRPPFSQSRFDSIWTVGNSMSCDRVEHLLVETLPSRSITLTLNGDQRLKRFECLNGSLKLMVRGCSCDSPPER